MYSAFCRFVYLPLLDRLRKVPSTTANREVQKNQHLVPEEMRALQVRKLKRLLRHAGEHSPYYRELFLRLSFHCDALRAPEDIRCLPILEKDDVRLHGERMKSPVFPGKVFENATSGSTGMSLRFVFDSEHAAYVQACVARGRSWWGVSPGARHLLLLGHPVGAARDTELRLRLMYRLRNSIEFDMFRDLDEARAREIHAACLRFRPTVIYGYGSGIGRLAETWRTLGIRLIGNERPQLVEYTADHMFENERLTAEDVLGAPVISGYGARECGAMAAVCRRRRFHWSADHALCEIVRPDGSPAAENEVGDLVVTPFDNFAMPFIRYRIGDRLSWSSEARDCRVELPVVHLHAGRASEIINTSERRAVSSVVFDFINRVNLVNAGIRGIRQFLVEQTALDDFALHVVRDEPFDPRSVEIFIDQTRQALGNGVRMRVRFVDTIPMEPTGKRRWYKRSYDPSATLEERPCA